MSDAVVRVFARDLGKTFRRHQGQATLSSLLRWVLRREPDAVHRSRLLTALEGVNFEIRHGELVGIVGNNGAGKTTLLRLIAGIYRASHGSVTVNGAITLLSGLGMGMLDDLTVHENIYLYGAICRMPRSEIDDCFDEIVSWAELEDFMDAPLRTLSTGMQSRLGFAIAMQVTTPVVLIDEALSAGDERFLQKCEAYFDKRRRDADCAMLIASHSLEFVERFCSRTLWLRHGEQVEFGRTAEVVAAYRAWSA